MRYLAQYEIGIVEQKPFVWLGLADGTGYEIMTPTIRDSVLVGNVQGKGLIRVKLSDIKTIAIIETDQEKTILWSVIGVTGVILIISRVNAARSSTCST